MFRFDDAYQKVYELTGNVYVFIGTYLAYGITSSMSDEEKTNRVLFELTM